MTQHKTDDNKLAYRTLARFYDILMGENKYPGWKKLIASVVEKYDIPKGTCLDIACGTGNISKLVKEFGVKVLGVAMSHEMNDVAQKKFPQDVFLTSDIRDFSLSDKEKSGITFAVSSYDSLNYLLTDENMLKMFESVYKNLPSGVIYLFDMNTTQHIEAAQQYKPRVLEEEDFYSVFRFGGEGRFWIFDMNFFVKDGETYQLVKEQHIERGYNREHILPLLKKAGFTLLDVQEEYKDYEDGNKLSRLYFIVRKP